MHVGSSNQPHAPGRHCAGWCFKLADFRGETKEEKKSITERIMEGCLKVLMENKIDRLEEKNHNVSHHKSSVKLVMGPRGKGRLLVGFVSPWALAVPLGPSFSFHHVLLPCSPSCAPPSTLAEVLASTGVTSSREPATHTRQAPPLYFLHLLAHSAPGTQWIQTVVGRLIFPICTLIFYIRTQTPNSPKSRQPETCSNA